MIKAIILDCFGVLATTGTWQQFIDGLPPDVDKAPIHKLHHMYDAGHIKRQDFLYRLEDLTGHAPVEIESLVTGDNIKNQPLLEYIRTELKPRYKIGLLSNIATDWITKSFLDAREQELFDDMVFSYQVGMTKPNPDIFRLSCSRLKVSPEEAVFVDDIASYARAASEVGLHGITYTSMSALRKELNELLTT